MLEGVGGAGLGALGGGARECWGRGWAWVGGARGDGECGGSGWGCWGGHYKGGVELRAVWQVPAPPPAGSVTPLTSRFPLPIVIYFPGLGGWRCWGAEMGHAPGNGTSRSEVVPLPPHPGCFSRGGERGSKQPPMPPPPTQ